MTVNHRVAGSSPADGAITEKGDVMTSRIEAYSIIYGLKARVKDLVECIKAKLNNRDLKNKSSGDQSDSTGE